MSGKEKLYIDVKFVTSPSYFTACIGKLIDFSEFDKYLKRLNKWCDENYTQTGGDVQQLQLEQSVLVKHRLINAKDDDDELEWKRAIVTSIEGNEMIKCYLIDDGQTVDLAREKIYSAKPDFFEEHEAHAKKCQLKNAVPENGSEWSQPAKELFRMLLKQPGLIVNEIEPTGCEKPKNFSESINARYVIEVLNKNKSLLDTLVSDGFATMNDPTFILTKTASTPVNTIPPELSFGKNQLTSNADDMSSVEMASQQSAKQTEDDECIFLTETGVNEDNDDDDDVVECEANEVKESITTSSISSLNTSTNKFPKKIRPSMDNSKKKQGLNSRNLNGDIVSYINLVQDDDNEEDDVEDAEEDINAYFAHKPTSTSDNMSIIKSRNFICSDETILTGYTPNIKIDGNQVTRAIRQAQFDRINKSKGITNTNHVENEPKKNQTKGLQAARNAKNLNNSMITRQSEIYENRIYEIIIGPNGFFKTIESKISNLNKVYYENEKENGTLILKCFLKELSNENMDCNFAFNIIQHLNFINDGLFDKTLNEFLVENGLWSNGQSTYMPQITDPQRKSICQTIANIYLRSIECPLVNCLKNMSILCCELVKEWITIYVNREISNHIYVRNLKNVHDFLEICMNKFCLQNLEIIDFVRQKSRVYSCDHALSNEIRAESVLILELFALKYLDVLQGRIDNEKVVQTSSNTRSIAPLMSNQSRNKSNSINNSNKNRNIASNNYTNYGYNDTRTSWTNTFRQDWAAERSDLSSNETDDFNQRGRFAYRLNESSSRQNNQNSLINDYSQTSNAHNNSYDDNFVNRSFNNINRMHESKMLAQRLEFFTQQFTTMSTTTSRYPSKRKSNNFK